MIEEIKVYTVVCDNCGKDVCNGEEYSGWNDSAFVEQIATECGWLVENDKHYCDECFSYNDEDELIINKNRTKKQ